MATSANIPSVDAPDEESPEILLRPVKIVHEDNTVETVYIQDIPAEPSQIHHKIHRHLSTVYLVVGIVALAMGAYVTYHQFKKRE